MNQYLIFFAHTTLVILSSSLGFGDASSILKVDYAWKYIDYKFPSPEAREKAIETGAYNYTKIIPLDGDVWQKGGVQKVFITMPRGLGSDSSLAAIPATLGTVSDTADPNNPESMLLAPYPDWSWHRDIGEDTSQCPSIMSSVYRVAIDELDRLWVLDSAEVGPCNPKLIVFDLNTDSLLAQHDLSNASTNSSFLLTPIVDFRDSGRDVFVYNTDATGAIIVYDDQSKASWRVSHPSFNAVPENSTFDIAGTTFELSDGLFGIALGPRRLSCSWWHRPGCRWDRTVYYHPLASVSESFVDASVLRNLPAAAGAGEPPAAAFKTFPKTRPSQSAAEVMSREGVLFSGLLSDLSITCWNALRSPFPGVDGSLQVVARDAETLQFPSGMKIRYGRLLVFTSRFQRFVTNTMKWNEVNYRLLSAKVDDLIRGTQCEFR